MLAPQHIDDDLMDRYALGSVPEDLLARVEEHLLTCKLCQSRLIETDEFIQLFRAAATQLDARPVPLTRRLLTIPVLRWAGAAAAAALVLFSISVASHRSAPAAATVIMRSLRGPESPAVAPARQPVVLVFDVTPTAPAENYEARIVDLTGRQLLAMPMELKDGHLSIRIDNLHSGSYWVRICLAADRNILAEYGLRAE